MVAHPVPADEIVQLSQRLYTLIGHLDNRRNEALAALFLPEGRWQRQGQWFNGREAILGALASRPKTMRVRHLLTNILVTHWTGDTASVQAYMTAYRQLEGGRPELFSINIVTTEFRRGEASQWLIAEQTMVREFEFPAT